MCLRGARYSYNTIFYCGFLPPYPKPSIIFNLRNFSFTEMKQLNGFSVFLNLSHWLQIHLIPPFCLIPNTLLQQHKSRLYIGTSPDGQHQNQIDYILCSQRWRGCIQSAKTRQGADCGSDHELLIAKFRLKLKKVGKTTRAFRYDLSQSLMTIQWKWEIDLRD